MRRRTGTALAALALAGTLAATACGGGESPEATEGTDGGGPELAVVEAFIPQPVNDDLAGGFLTVENTGDTDDTLVSVTTPAAASVELHTTEDSAMRQVDSFPVPAGGTLELRRGGDHLMLIELTGTLTEGDSVTLELHFRTSDPLTVDVPVMAATHTGNGTGPGADAADPGQRGGGGGGDESGRSGESGHGDH
ncbi:copper chaperone PCu(A)C [Streptomyces sp. YIM 98790]|uniref:copper chaperone PCu(A)C n=1 Tax=Streptomyces sp. YIM 98790 TaxID=2689077 RepID=UPI0014074E63|nr:copper chaperone PCu(A)C [Streptomyces sp. YIM 98790]